LVKLAVFFAALWGGLPAHATDGASEGLSIRIAVERGNWGSARPQDIQLVLGSVADMLVAHFPQRASKRITVQPGGQGPKVLFEKSSAGEYRVLLNVRDTRWDQFAYQFSHELCHILTNFEQRKVDGDVATRDHQWFEETVCEAVSLSSLARLASIWKDSPPYPGWNDYAPAFAQYAERLLSADHRRLPADQSLTDWYRANREELARNPYLREKNEHLAVGILPLLESRPNTLGAIAYLNLDAAPGQSFSAYLEAWLRCSPEQYRAFIQDIMSLLGERTNVVASGSMD
jgi:hypothetical protein